MKLFLTLLILLISFIGNAQIQMKNISLITPDSAVAYTYQLNQLEFWGINQKKKYTLICNGDTITNYYKNSFLFHPKSPSRHVKLQLFRKKKLIQEFDIRVENLGRLKVRLGILTDSVVTKYDLLNNLYFNLNYSPQLMKPYKYVKDYQLKLYKSTGEEIPIRQRDSVLTTYLGEISYLDDLIYEYESLGLNIEILRAYQDKIYDIYVNMPMFLPEVVGQIALMEHGGIISFESLTFGCPDCAFSYSNEILRYIIKGD